MSNVSVTVEHGLGPRGLLGLYEGGPLTSRTTAHAGFRWWYLSAAYKAARA
jgi:predicted Zn-dependent protease with MMP-like domain